MSNAHSISMVLLALRKASGGVWGRFDHGRPGVGVAEWAVIIGATVLLVGVMCVSSWRAKRRKAEFLSDSKSKMFGELAQAHRLDRAQRRLLRKLAASHDARDASQLFVEPQYFEAEKMSVGLQSAASELRQLRHELFERQDGAGSRRGASA